MAWSCKFFLSILLKIICRFHEILDVFDCRIWNTYLTLLADCWAKRQANENEEKFDWALCLFLWKSQSVSNLNSDFLSQFYMITLLPPVDGLKPAECRLSIALRRKRSRSKEKAKAHLSLKLLKKSTPTSKIHRWVAKVFAHYHDSDSLNIESCSPFPK